MARSAAIFLTLLALSCNAFAQDSPPNPAQEQLDFANGLFSREFFDEAAAEYQKVLHQYAGTEQAHTAALRLGEAAFATRDFEKSLAALDTFLATGPTGVLAQRAGLTRAESLYQLQRYADARAALDALLQGEVDAELRPRALYHAGLSAKGAGDTAAAQARLQALLKEYPDNALAPYAKFQLAFVHEAQGDTESAVSLLTEIAEDGAPDDLKMEARYRSGELYDKLGWYGAASGAYLKLRESYPNSPYANQAWFGLAWSQYHDGKYAEALASADAYLAANPAATELAALGYLRGNCLQQLQRLDEALAIYNEIRQKYPDSEYAGRSTHKVAWVLYLQGNLEGALQELNGFLQSNPDSPSLPEAAFLLGMIQTAQGDYEAAQSQFQRVADQYPQSTFGAEARYRAAECLQQLGSFAAAATAFASFATSLEDHPLARDAYLRAGEARLASKQYADAVPMFKAALELGLVEAQAAEVQYRIALALHNAGDAKGSIDAYGALLQKYPASPHAAECHYRLADYALAVEKDPVKALTSYQSAIEAAPDGPFAAQSLRGAAVARFESKDFESAANTFLDCITKYPASPLPEEAYVWAGEYFLDQKAWSKAIITFEAMLKGLPSYPTPERVLLKIAECAAQGGESIDVIPRLQAVVDAAPASSLAAEARFRMARLHESQGQKEEAMKLYEAAAESNTGDVGARSRFRLAELLNESGKAEEAAREYMRVAILYLHEELSPAALLQAGKAYEVAGKPGQAKKAYAELVKDFADAPSAGEAREALARLEGG